MDIIKKMHIGGTLFTIIMGSLLHFVWEWSDRMVYLIIFSAISESTWEHLKLLFFPVLLFTLIEYFVYGKEIDRFFTVKLYTVLVGMSIIVVTFYTYTGILGTNYLLLDIGIFILAVIYTYLGSYRYITKDKKCLRIISNRQALMLMGALVLVFAVFSFYPPDLALFQAPE